MVNDKKENSSLIKINEIKKELSKVVVWQDLLIESMLVSLFSGWHVILEWVPWLAKTLTVQTLAKTLSLNFSRISFTPDLLPWDLLGWQIYNQHESKFYTKKWPIFTNLLLADEINRAPSKVQSALLEAMQEGNVTIADETFKLDYPFFVLATQNPIEQEWTYPLPEAQLDRFLLKILITYPSKQEEIEIMQRSSNKEEKIETILSKKDLNNIMEQISNEVYVDEKIFSYVRDIVFATRNPDSYDLSWILKYISYWASPRASIWFIKASKALAFISGRDFVTPDDIKRLAFEILRHRIWLTFEAIWENLTQDDIISMILSKIIVP